MACTTDQEQRQSTRRGCSRSDHASAVPGASLKPEIWMVAIRSRGAAVGAEQAAEAVAASDTLDRYWFGFGLSVDQVVSNSLMVPLEVVVGRDVGTDLGEQPAAQGLAPDRQAPPLIVAEPQPPAAELLAEHPVLFAQILDRSLLAIAEPPGEDRGEELKGWVHPARVPIRPVPAHAGTLERVAQHTTCGSIEGDGVGRPPLLSSQPPASWAVPCSSRAIHPLLSRMASPRVSRPGGCR
jgi:hypothetical protein